MTYCAIGQNGWGKSPDAVMALKRARQNGSSGKYILHLVNDGCEVDQIDGTLYYDSKRDGVNLALATVTLR